MGAGNAVGASFRGMFRRRPANLAVLAGFVVAGMVTTILGPLLPVLISRWSLTDQQAGLFFTLQFASNIAGVASLSALIPRCGYKFALVAGYLAIAFGLAGLNFPMEMVGLAATAAYGFGLGLVLPAANLWVAEKARSRRVAALSILNFVWGAGAIACAPLVLAAQRHSAIPAFLYGLAGAALIAAALLLLVNLRTPAHEVEPDAESVSHGNRIAALALGVLFFLYVGAENSVAGWAADFAKRMPNATGGIWTLAPMFFWGGLMAGRASVPANPLRRRERLLVGGGLCTGLAGNIALITATRFWAVAICQMVIGLGFAAIYPVLVAWLAKQFGEGARRTGNLMFVLAAMGGATMPWMVGFFSTRENSLRTGLLVPVALCAAMLACLPWIPKRVAS